MMRCKSRPMVAQRNRRPGTAVTLFRRLTARSSRRRAENETRIASPVLRGARPLRRCRGCGHRQAGRRGTVRSRCRRSRRASIRSGSSTTPSRSVATHSFTSTRIMRSMRSAGGWPDAGRRLHRLAVLPFVEARAALAAELLRGDAAPSAG